MKRIFDKEAIVPDVPGIILLSHSELAVAMAKTAAFICGESENIAAFSFEDEDTPADYCDAFMEAVNAFPEGSVVLVDIFGGSPCNQLMVASKRQGKKIYAMSGMSLPMVVAAINSRSFEKGEGLLQSIQDELEGFVVNITDKLEGR